MAHYAKVNNGIVEEIIVAEAGFFDTFIDSSPGAWIQTSYNTRGGKHYDQDSNEDGGTPLRKNYAKIDHPYDLTRDAFLETQPYPSWTLNETSCFWEAPVAMPDNDKVHEWNEDTTAWVEVE